MGTKSNPGRFDCYEKAAPDEPMFVLLARDPRAPHLVRAWARAEELAKGIPTTKSVEARQCATAMEEWARNHPKKEAKHEGVR